MRNASKPELTQPIDWLNKPAVGYVVNTPFSPENAAKLGELASEINTELEQSLFCPPLESLHITLMDWIAPLIDYDKKDKDQLFAEIHEGYDALLQRAISLHGPITVNFDTIKVAPNTIFILGHDDGQFQNIRDKFVNSVKLLPGTKLPPTIIHSSLGRFIKQIDMEKVNKVVASKTLNITQLITDFRLVKTPDATLVHTELIKQYALSKVGN